MTIYVNNTPFILKKTDEQKTLIQLLKQFNLHVPKFCFHEQLQIAGNCRMCLIEIENFPKPVAACAMPVAPQMRIFTNTPLVKKARESVLEFLLLNHPLDCPICDQGGECDLQDQALTFGNDRGRFFETKRTVEDKNCGPFIKTIMTRCIHCTRCVRFSEEIGGIDGLGTVGRGNKTEISFYLNKIFQSELSGNVIDLCPVGALTSKPYAFQARPWELRKHTGIDVLDNLGTAITVQTHRNAIVRILPETNPAVNHEWISNKTRFFFDSLQYQRLTQPMARRANTDTFTVVTWKESLGLLRAHLVSVDAAQVQVTIGQFLDPRTLFLFKTVLTTLGCSPTVAFEQKRLAINADFSGNYLFQESLTDLEASDCCLLVGCNPRREATLLNLRLKKHRRVYYIGSRLDTNISFEHLGTSLATLNRIVRGNHVVCQSLKRATTVSIVVGEDFLQQPQTTVLLTQLMHSLGTSVVRINTLHMESGFLPFVDFFSMPIRTQKTGIAWLLNTTNALPGRPYPGTIVYQGHFFTPDAGAAHVILPNTSLLEKDAFFVNVEGTVTPVPKVVVRRDGPNGPRDDVSILHAFLRFLALRAKIKHPTTRFSLLTIHPYFTSTGVFPATHVGRFTVHSTVQHSWLKKNISHLIAKNNLEFFSKILSSSLLVFPRSSNF